MEFINNMSRSVTGTVIQFCHVNNVNDVNDVNDVCRVDEHTSFCLNVALPQAAS